MTYSFVPRLHRATRAHPSDNLDLEFTNSMAHAGAKVGVGPLDLLYGIRSGDPGTTIVFTAHRDQIGLRVSHYDDEGFASFVPVGGWDPQVLVGQPVSFGRDGVRGVIGRKAVHLLKDGEDKVAAKIESLWVDFGFKTGDEARAALPVGTFGVIDRDGQHLNNDRYTARALDDLAGCVVAVEAMKRCEVTPHRPGIVTALTKHEETIWLGASGNFVAQLEPTVVVAVDVTFAEDPDTTAKDNAGIKLGKGPVIYHGGMFPEDITRRIVEIAKAAGIPYQEAALGGHSSTDADGMALGGYGQNAVLISIPLRYMHSPVELVELADLEHTAQLLVAVHDAAARRAL